MTNQPNKATVKDGLPTAKKVLAKHYDVDNRVDEAAIVYAMQSYSDQQNAELKEKLRIETQKAKAFGNALDIATKDELALKERVKELEAKLSEIADIDQEDDTAWERMKEIRADDYDLKTEREEEIFQFAFFEGIRYIQKALKK